MSSKAKVLIAIVILLLVVGSFFLIINQPAPPTSVDTPLEETMIEATEDSTPTSTQEIIGSSVEGRNIEVYTFGTGENNLLFVGGIHGGYEWNSIALAYEMVDHFSENFETIPDNVTLHIIPNLNPDGLYAATQVEGKVSYNKPLGTSMHASGLGRLNANNVDLNRNFGCKWAPESTWRGNTVDAGSAAFSEPEAAALRDYVLKTSPKTVVFWHSMANNVYASECENGVIPETLVVMNTYADAAGYGAVPVFDAYPITGDAEGWLASIDIPAITVELGSRTSIEWSKNLSGTEAVLKRYEK